MENTICAICGRPTEDILLTVDGKENICMDCATKMAVQAKTENRKTQSKERSTSGSLQFLITRGRV